MRWLLVLVAFLLPTAVRGSPLSPETVRYALEITVAIPADSITNGNLRLWIPYPPNTPSQKINRALVKAPLRWQIKQEKKFGNHMLYLEGKTLPQPWTVTLLFDVERKVDRGGPRPWNPKHYLGPTLWIPFSEEIERIASKETKGLQTPFQKIRALYNYIYETMTYNKEGEGWGRGDPIWACANKRGNCTDFHSLFIALARSQNIPARFEMGLPIPGDQTEGVLPGYHCWAQAFDPTQGWIPLDVSESKKIGQKDFYFQKLGSNRILLSVGRGLVLEPPQRGEPLNFFFTPYAERNGKKWEGVKARHSFRRL